MSNAQLFGKVYFPRLIVPHFHDHLESVFGGHSVGRAAGFLGVTSSGFTSSRRAASALSLELIALPLLILQIGAVSMGVGLWMAALTVKYRDFSHLSSFIVQLWMYGTPVIFLFR